MLGRHQDKHYGHPLIPKLSSSKVRTYFKGIASNGVSANKNIEVFILLRTCRRTTSGLVVRALSHFGQSRHSLHGNKSGGLAPRKPRRTQELSPVMLRLLSSPSREAGRADPAFAGLPFRAVCFAYKVPVHLPRVMQILILTSQMRRPRLRQVKDLGHDRSTGVRTRVSPIRCASRSDPSTAWKFSAWTCRARELLALVLLLQRQAALHPAAPGAVARVPPAPRWGDEARIEPQSTVGGQHGAPCGC